MCTHVLIVFYGITILLHAALITTDFTVVTDTIENLKMCSTQTMLQEIPLHISKNYSFNNENVNNDTSHPLFSTKKNTVFLNESVHTDVEWLNESVHNDVEWLNESVHNDVEWLNESVHTDVEWLNESVHNDAEWLNESVPNDVQWLHESVHTDVEWLNESVHNDVQWLNESVHNDVQWLNESVHNDVQWLNESVHNDVQWLNESVHNNVEWINKTVRNNGDRFTETVQNNTDRYDETAHNNAEWLNTSVSTVFIENTFHKELHAKYQFYVSSSDCNYTALSPISEADDYVHVLLTNNYFTDNIIFCQWMITVQEEKFILASAEISSDTCSENLLINIREERALHNEEHFISLSCSIEQNKRIIATLSNQIYVKVKDVLTSSYSLQSFHLAITVASKSPRLTLPTVFETPHSGYVTSPGYSVDSFYPHRSHASYRLAVPAEHAVMVSFQHFDILPGLYGDCDKIYFELYSVDDNESLRLEWKYCSESSVPPTHVYNNSLVIRFTTDKATSFKMLFSFHPRTLAPQVTDTGMVDCAVPHYDTFKQHLECNLELECKDGRDEHKCPFSSRDCNGSVAFGNKCYTYQYATNSSILDDAQEMCQNHGGNLAMPKTPGEREAVHKLFYYGKRAGPAVIGLKRFPFLWNNSYYGGNSMYSKMWVWVDGTMAYSVNITGDSLQNYNFEIAALRKNLPLTFLSVSRLSFIRVKDYVCEKEIPYTKSQIKKAFIQFPRLEELMENVKTSNWSLVQCEDGHFTYDFMICQPDSFCSETAYSLWCQVPDVDVLKNGKTDVEVVTRTDMFVCEDGKRTLHYTLVCDFKTDCMDGSDEDFCSHFEQCPEYTCLNAQCISLKETCDNFNHCWDASDESSCPNLSTEIDEEYYNASHPTIIDFDANRKMIREQLRTNICPASHFRCYGDSGYCLPVYVRCNGVNDCSDREDEADCDVYRCPGLFRCRNSTICIHVKHLCDGWAQCPEREDEMLCGFRCPEECQCQGLAIICHRRFSTQKYQKMRYLDASGSNLSVADVVKNVYIVWLSLRQCNIDHIVEMAQPNLKVLDLSDNLLTYVDMKAFHTLSYLSDLNLAGNPIAYLKQSQLGIEHLYLQRLDLSRTAIRIFDSTALSPYRHISFLNISYSLIESITNTGFFHVPEVRKLDIRGNALEVFPRNVFKQLSQLEVVFAENYKLCCKEVLPDFFNDNFCFAPRDQVSSCEDLLRSNVFRGSHWIMTAMTIVGNAGCFIFRVFFKRDRSRSGYGVFVINLSVSDFLMGLYLIVVGGADQLYLGNYLWYDYSWRTSMACKFAGFTSLLSIEVSSIVIFLITLDRFIVVRFPFSTCCFQKRSAVLACGIAWLVGVVLAAVPLLSVTSHFQFYEQTGICVPLLVTRRKFSGKSYLFSLIIVFNFALFILIAVGQSFVFWAIRANSMTTNTTGKSKDAIIARRLTFIVLSNLLCFFPIGLTGVLASTGALVSSEINVAMAIFVLPLNAALNPFSYTLNILLEKRRKAHELRLLKLLEDRFESMKHKQHAVKPVKPIDRCHLSLEKTAIRVLSDRIKNHAFAVNENATRLQNYNQVDGNTETITVN